MGVASASTETSNILVAGIACLVAEAMSMAASVYASVSSQADNESADLAHKRGELGSRPEAKLKELTQIYVKRGLERQLA